MLHKYDKSTRLRILLWSVAVATVAGMFGVVALTLLPGGFYSATPPPLLGQPFGYQTIQTCNAVVCAPVALNDLLVAIADYTIYFAVGFIVTLLVQLILVALWSQKDGFNWHLVPASFLVIAVLIVAVDASGSIAAGASFSQPHWPPPSGIEAYPLDNITLYSGTASTASLQGTAHLDISFVNLYWKSLTIPVNATLTTSNGTVISVYECQSPNSCSQVSMLLLPNAYSEFNLNQPTTAFYFGTEIVKGANYKLAVGEFGGAMITQFSTSTAQ